MVTGTYKNGNPSFQASITVDYPIRKPEECPFYGEHVIFYKKEVSKFIIAFANLKLGDNNEKFK